MVCGYLKIVDVPFGILEHLSIQGSIPLGFQDYNVNLMKV